MNQDDIVYLSLLILSIGIGYYYSKIQDKYFKKKIGTLIGLSMVFIVSGVHIIHPLIVTVINSCIILYTSQRKCHLMSFVFTFAYLLFFRTTIYFGIPYPPAHTNLIQMMLTLKLVGLAFEVNTNYNSKQKNDDIKESEEEEVESDIDISEITISEIFHYCFNYIGVLTGPYYRYRTFCDYLNEKYASAANCKQHTMDKLKWIPLFAALFLWGSYNWPLSYAQSAEFYEERSWLYRYWYIWPNFFIFRMRIYIGLVLSECVCTMSGLGAYPVFTEPKPGQGPSQNFGKLKAISSDLQELQQADYNFETIHNINPYGADFCTTYREAMKHWNICIQYWLAVNVYKRFPYRKYRTVVTLLVSSYWHGVYTGYYVCIGTVPFVLAIEDIYYKLLIKGNTGMSLKVAEWIMWFFKMHFFSYQAIAFLLLDVQKIMYYYNSVYHVGLFLGLGLYLLGLFLWRRNDRSKVHKCKKELKTE